MPNYQAFRQGVQFSDPRLAHHFGDLLAVYIASPRNAGSIYSSIAYFLPYWNTTQLGVDAARDYGFRPGSQSIVVTVRSLTHSIDLFIPAAQIRVEAWLPADFVKIGSETMLRYFQFDQRDLPTLLSPLPRILRMTRIRGNCRPRQLTQLGAPVLQP